MLSQVEGEIRGLREQVASNNKHTQDYYIIIISQKLLCSTYSAQCELYPGIEFVIYLIEAKQG